MNTKSTFKIIFMLLISIFIIQNVNAGWQQSKTYWPRLTYESSDISIIRAHYEAVPQGIEPYKTLWERIQKKASKTPKIGDKDWGQQNVNGAIAKARALLFVLTSDITQADQARDILLSMYTGEEIPKYGIKGITLKLTQYKNLKSAVMQSIFMAQSITQHCQAYDMLKGAGYQFGTNEKKIKDNIATLAGRIYDISNWVSGGSKAANILVADVEEQNNFQLKMMSALGVAAICLNDHPDAEKWINRAMTKFWQVYNAQTTSYGGYGEGPFYFLYAGINFIPFFRAYNLFMDGQGGTYDGYAVPNFLTNDRVAKVFDWHIKIRMPNGDRPGYDDGYYTSFFSGLLVSSPAMSGHATDHHPSANLGVYAWDWLNSYQMENGYDNRYMSEFGNMDLTVDLFCVFDNEIQPTPPPGSPTQFFSDAGNVVLRSDWGNDAVYLHLLGEKNTMRIIGGAHEHPDAGSYVIFAYGELLALDSGYPGFPQHELVNQAQNHNVILVDNQGPLSDAELMDFFDTDFLDFAVVRMTYAGAMIERNILFVDNYYFLIYDIFESSSPHEYTWMLHGNAGADVKNSSFTKTALGGIWKRAKASLEAFVVTDQGTPTYEVKDDYHSLTFAGDNTLPKHTVLRVKQTASQLRMLSLLVPYASGSTTPSVKPLVAVKGVGLQIEEKKGVIAFANNRGDADKIEAMIDLPRLIEFTTDGTIAFLQFSPQHELPVLMFTKNASNLSIGKKQFVNAKQKCSIAFGFNESKKEYSGQVQGPENNELSFRFPTNKFTVTGAKNYSYRADTQQLKLEFEKPNVFRIRQE